MPAVYSAQYSVMFYSLVLALSFAVSAKWHLTFSLFYKVHIIEGLWRILGKIGAIFIATYNREFNAIYQSIKLTISSMQLLFPHILSTISTYFLFYRHIIL